ncbi:MAG TPA: response regulator, partial [Nitrospirae bacterium]|nr:response regulator [Nitrospirota bacterium]
MNNYPPLLLVDDEQHILLSYTTMLRTEGIEKIFTLNDSREVIPLLEKKSIPLVVLDLNMPHISGAELLDKIKLDFPHVAVIFITAINDLETAVECMKKGALDYLVKPVENSRFISSVKKALELSSLREEVSSLRHHILSLRQHLLSDRLEHEDAFSTILTQNKK